MTKKKLSGVRGSLKLWIQVVGVESISSCLLPSSAVWLLVCPCGLVGVLGQAPYRTRRLSRTSIDGMNSEEEMVLITYNW